jgi:fermentation-respiration switch protein FrsA (DUF1100 family)
MLIRSRPPDAGRRSAATAKALPGPRGGWHVPMPSSIRYPRRRWGKEEPHDLSLIRQPVLLANGDNDRMLPTPNTRDMARRLPNNELVIYPDAGHGGIFQVPRAVRREGPRVPREVAPRRPWASTSQRSSPRHPRRLLGSRTMFGRPSSGGLKPPTFGTRPPLRICRHVSRRPEAYHEESAQQVLEFLEQWRPRYFARA